VSSPTIHFQIRSSTESSTNARFAPSGGNRQGTHVTVVRDATVRQRLGELNVTGARRYFAQLAADEKPWNPIAPTSVPAQTIADTAVPDEFTAPFRRASVVLVITVDLAYVATMDQDLDRVGVVSGTLTTMAVPEEAQIRDLLGIPDTHAVAALLPLGKPTRQLARLRRRPVEEFTTRDRFDGPPFQLQG
jgi:nitroreductase